MAEHDRKTRVNVNVPPWIVAWLAAVLDKHPGVWRSKGDLALDVLKEGMRAFELGLSVRPAVPPTATEAAGKGLNVSLPSETVPWFEAVLRERPDVARSRRDLVLVVLRTGMRTFERLDVQSTSATAEEDAEIVVPAELVRAIRDLLRAHPAIDKVVGKKTPAEWTARQLRDAVDRNLQIVIDDRDPKKEEIDAFLPEPVATEGAKGTVRVSADVAREIRRFIDDYRAFARREGYDSPAAFVLLAVKEGLRLDEEWAIESLETEWTCPGCGETMSDWDKSGHLIKRRACWDAVDRLLLSPKGA